MEVLNVFLVELGREGTVNTHFASHADIVNCPSPLSSQRWHPQQQETLSAAQKYASTSHWFQFPPSTPFLFQFSSSCLRRRLLFESPDLSCHFPLAEHGPRSCNYSAGRLIMSCLLLCVVTQVCMLQQQQACFLLVYPSKRKIPSVVIYWQSPLAHSRLHARRETQGWGNSILTKPFSMLPLLSWHRAAAA